MTAETALITGASAGIGWELARQFAAEKSNLVLVARRRERLEELAADLRKEHGVEVRVVAADLGRTDAPQAIADSLTRDGVTVDVLVNNAGFGALGPVAELDLQPADGDDPGERRRLDASHPLAASRDDRAPPGRDLERSLDRRLSGRTVHGRLLCHEGLRHLLQRGPVRRTGRQRT